MIKVAVVGFGFMGQTHTSNILKNNKMHLVAIVDKNQEQTKNEMTEKAGNFSIGNITADQLLSIKNYLSIEECIEKEAVDAFVISVHTNLHYKLSKTALEAGKHVFLEKPFCLDIVQAQELINLADNKNLILMIGHVVRFMPPYLKLKSWIDSSEFGKLKFLSLSRFSGIPNWGQWKEKQHVNNFTGGALFDLSIHDIDFALWILGEPDSIICNYLPGKLSLHDYINANWRYNAKNIQVKIEGGNIFHSKFPFQAGFSANFENASISFSSSNLEFIYVYTDEEVNQIPTGSLNDGFCNEIEYFTNCIINNTKPVLCTAESALHSVKLCYKHSL